MVQSTGSTSLPDFPDAERTIREHVERRLTRQDRDGQFLPVTAELLAETAAWLVDELGIPPAEVRLPGLALRAPRYRESDEAPEPELINSFFLQDLLRVQDAFRKGDVGTALESFLSGLPSRARMDITQDRDELARILEPARTPLARWPTPGNFPLVLMQQAAVNHAAHDLADRGLVGVNGPPGTGKTTLLRDVVAKIVVDRAVALCRFERPESVFIDAGSASIDGRTTRLYHVQPQLLGHEIVVASSNNKAVENISREIPSSSAISDEARERASYFASLSDAIAGKGDGETWGLLAAVLGNSKNCSAFADAFWWDKQRSMATYLKWILDGGRPTQTTAGSTPEPPTVVVREQPPQSAREALARWDAARKEFAGKLATAEALRAQLADASLALRQERAAADRAAAAREDLENAVRHLELARASHSAEQRTSDSLASAERHARERSSAIRDLKPGFFAKLFGTRAYHHWLVQMTAAIDAVDAARSHLRAATASLEELERRASAAAEQLARAQEDYAAAEHSRTELRRRLDAGTSLLDSALPDDRFWAQDEEHLQLATPWLSRALFAARADLFVAALKVHRAFIDAAAPRLRHNLRAAVHIIKSGSLGKAAPSVYRSVWASLCLVVPVISTTFASVSRLFRGLGREELGWLLIDEAGQAVPQAAVGALWRAKRAVVIGDPMQIQPVVTMPPKLVRAIASEFGVDDGRWTAPSASVQVLADRASWLGAEIRTSSGDAWVGCLLRVHRRCDDPMFSIANDIAYGGLMVHGTPLAASTIGDVLGESAWLDVHADVVGKWSPQEGIVALGQLRRLFEAGLPNPNVYVISPFKIVAGQLRDEIPKDAALATCLGTGIDSWLQHRVGTVHTFQGKEAESVLLVLGAPSDSEAGARRWAAGTPNLLNVAVTRAKRRLYVIGSRRAWQHVGVFRNLAANLPAILA